MQTDTSPWRIVQFVGSAEAYDLVRQLQGDPSASVLAEGSTTDEAGGMRTEDSEEEGADEIFSS